MIFKIIAIIKGATETFISVVIKIYDNSIQKENKIEKRHLPH